ncbi:MAG: hypothetical protein ACK5L4_13240, partial [Pseudanabaena sp.]
VAALGAATCFWGLDPEHQLYSNTNWLRHFVFLKPLQGLVFNSQKCSHTFVNWYYFPITNIVLFARS